MASIVFEKDGGMDVSDLKLNLALLVIWWWKLVDSNYDSLWKQLIDIYTLTILHILKSLFFGEIYPNQWLWSNELLIYCRKWGIH